MKKQFIVANWKSHKTTEEAKDWLTEFAVHSSQIAGDKEIIICPSFPLLPMIAAFIRQHHENFFIGTQDISPYPEGAYTGAVSGKLLKEFGTYAIIGHSERRQYFHESLEDLSKKVTLALSCGITPIYCVSKKDEKIPAGVKIVAFEPIAAIGSGAPEDPTMVEAIASFIKQKNSVLYVLYGGSVTPDNVNTYTSLSSINGVLVGGASLSADTFADIIQHA